MKGKDAEFTRRGFLSAAFSGLVSAGLLGVSPRRVLSRNVDEKKESNKKDVIRRQLGSSGITMPVVGMGVMNSDNPGLVRASYELGVRHFDTAAYYQRGKNEEMVGKVIKDMKIRDDVVVGTKIFTEDMRGDLKPKETRRKIAKACGDSLKRLKMDYVDILYVHDIKEPETSSNEDIIEAMTRLKREGKARCIGVSTHTKLHEIINEAVKTEAYDVVLTVINFTLADYGELFKSISNAASKGVGIIAMKTQAGSHRRSKLDFEGRYSGSTIATAALKWVLHNGDITAAIPGYTTYEHMRQDFSVVYDLEYDSKEKALLSECDLKVGMGFCRQCRVCMDQCPHGVDVPALMRTHMYAARYSNFSHARATLDAIPAEEGLGNCRLCRACRIRCINSVDVAKNIDELKLMYA